MKWITVAAAVLNQTPMDWDGNQARIIEAIEQARSIGATVLCLPELCISGYGCEDAFHGSALRRMARRVLYEIMPHTRGMIVGLGLPVLYHNGLFNTVCVVVDGQIQGFVAKRHLAGEGLHYEPRWFKPWPTGVTARIDIDGNNYPIGDLHFDVGGVKIGFEICEDAWVACRPGGSMAGLGVDLILNPSASHFAFGKHAVRERFVLEGSRAFGATYVYSNLVGNEAGRAVYDGGALIATGGRMVARGPRFVFKDVHIASARIDVDATRMAQARSGSFSPTIGDDGRCVRVGFEFPDAGPGMQDASSEAWEFADRVESGGRGRVFEPPEPPESFGLVTSTRPNGHTAPDSGGSEYLDPGHPAPLEFEEFTRAIALALFDYMRKSRANGYVVSLSGGADSAAVACLVAMSVQLASAQLGPRGLAAKLAYIKSNQLDSQRDWTPRLLTCVYQSTANSSATTRDAARTVAGAVGAEFVELDVDGLVKEYTTMIEAALNTRLTWERDDVALQNIQARVRGPGVWMIANLKGAILAATSNRSEAAVGYATMDGDTCGGISPLAGIDKAFIRAWLKWLQFKGPTGLGPIPELQCVNAQAPTAELRPQSRHQTDEADLMPYDVLDAIENAAIGGKLAPDETLESIRVQFPAIAENDLRMWVYRFFKLWCRNQWKRERYAPSFHVDDKNLDPKTWCRFPILSGGFERELAEMK